MARSLVLALLLIGCGGAADGGALDVSAPDAATDDAGMTPAPDAGLDSARTCECTAVSACCDGCGITAAIACSYGVCAGGA